MAFAVNIDNAKAIMDRNNGVGPGFDALRLSLALSVVLVHCFAVAHYAEPISDRLWDGPLRPFLLAILPMFFGLSGFLVAGSALRTKSVATFFRLRLLRLAPALTVEVTMSALILGPLLTVLPLRAYFTDPLFLSYFGNIVGRVQFYLPGMFTALPMPGVVNFNLWTLAPEYYCYLFMLLLMMSGVLYDRKKTTFVAAAMAIVFGIGNTGFGVAEQSTIYGAAMLLNSFVLGVAAYHWRDRIPVHGALFVVAIAMLYVAWQFRGTALIGAVPMMYCVVYLGMQRLPRLNLLPKGDYSYGIYLYGFPIQQTLIYVFPQLKVWWLLFPVSALATLALAMLSWHFIERPALAFRKNSDPGSRAAASVQYGSA
jgi:peptidoglycan/LPS O-acetylase OafA/YrhL